MNRNVMVRKPKTVLNFINSTCLNKRVFFRSTKSGCTSGKIQQQKKRCQSQDYLNAKMILFREHMFLEKNRFVKPIRYSKSEMELSVKKSSRAFFKILFFFILF